MRGSFKSLRALKPRPRNGWLYGGFTSLRSGTLGRGFPRLRLGSEGMHIPAMSCRESSSSLAFAAASPIRGVSLDLASLLIHAIKTRRKHMSKSFSSATRSGHQETADDAAAAFICELRRQVEQSAKSSRKRQLEPDKGEYTPNAATFCMVFLLDSLSGAGNSFHLRRALLMLARSILERSSDARMFFSSGRVLMDFIMVVQETEGGEEEETSASADTASPKMMFHRDILELMQSLVSKFGRLYPKFVVASRLLGHVSASCDIVSSLEVSRPISRTMESLRLQRDIALRRGPKACDILARMIQKADHYFQTLVPRFGGLINDDDSQNDEIGRSFGANSRASVDSVVVEEESTYCHIDDDQFNSSRIQKSDMDENDDGDSIDWEEGDINLMLDADADPVSSQSNSLTAANTPKSGHENSYTYSSVDHCAEVTRTLALMETSGSLFEGGLSVRLDLPTSVSDTHDATRVNLQLVVEDLNARRLPRLRQWIYALSHADGLESSSHVDPVSNLSGTGQKEPITLVLLSEDRRALHGPLLQRMMTVKTDIERVLHSATALGVIPRGENIRASNKEVRRRSATKINWFNTTRAVVGRRAASKKSRGSKFKVIYRRKA